MKDKQSRFMELAEAVYSCRLCPRMESRTRVLGPQNGSLESPVLFIAEAPGRLGADRYEIPLWGDQTGNNFARLLAETGWRREWVFITNAVLCNPRDDTGLNSSPTAEEIQNCSCFLKETIEIIKPRLLVPLGQTALRALHFIHPHTVILRKDVGQLIPWKDYSLVPLYHPSPRAMVHRSEREQREDYRRLGDLLGQPTAYGQIHFLEPGPGKTFLSRYQQLLVRMATIKKGLSRFQMAKLSYLVDWEHFKTHQYTLTSATYLRYLHGPVARTFYTDLERLTEKGILLYRGKGGFASFQDIGVDFTFEQEMLIGTVVESYGNLSERDLATLVYRTPPMQYIKRQEGACNPLLYRVVPFRIP